MPIIRSSRVLYRWSLPVVFGAAKTEKVIRRCNKCHLLHLVGVLFPHINDDAQSKSLQTHFVFNNFSFSENRAVYEIMWKNIGETGRPQMIIWRMYFAFCITKATDTHPDYVILIAFPLQQWLHERAPLLCYTYITFCLFHCYCPESDVSTFGN